jgi:hypothetical protein
METLILSAPLFAAAGYSFVYLLAGGGVVGAIVIFIIAKMLGQ